MNERTYYELIAEINKAGLEVPAKLKRMIRDESAKREDLLEKSIRKDWRRVYTDECGECWYDYHIFPDNGETDDVIQDVVDELEIRNYSQYDCTGKPFTRWLHWKRVPAGIVVIHAQALDV